ncbi:hypothetical protein GGR51DRAFT_535643 [Nemania sp. FL0031]|nr:hypothetical protein GGR51DRAFT_535643 [Nemania sp. FL0031]
MVRSFVYSGSESRAREILAPFFELSPLAKCAGAVPRNEVSATNIFGKLHELGGVYDVFSSSVRQL